jgi:threonine dehydrogenase-like Zn-dependent dehydrogenase
LFQERGIEACLIESIGEKDDKYHVVVDCTGNEQGFDTALNLVRPRCEAKRDDAVSPQNPKP